MIKEGVGSAPGLATVNYSRGRTGDAEMVGKAASLEPAGSMHY